LLILLPFIRRASYGGRYGRIVIDRGWKSGLQLSPVMGFAASGDVA